MQSDQSNLFFGLTQIAGVRQVALYTRDKGEETLVAAAPVDPRRPVTLTIRANGGTMAFDYGTGAAKRTLKDGLDARFLSTNRAGGFVGTVIGPFAYTR